jgi:hypothetical protein
MDLPPLSPSGSRPLRGLREGNMKAPALHFSLPAKAVNFQQWTLGGNLPPKVTPTSPKYFTSHYYLEK